MIDFEKLSSKKRIFYKDDNCLDIIIFHRVDDIEKHPKLKEVFNNYGKEDNPSKKVIIYSSISFLEKEGVEIVKEACYDEFEFEKEVINNGFIELEDESKEKLILELFDGTKTGFEIYKIIKEMNKNA
jgi:hypothetical protein